MGGGKRIYRAIIGILAGIFLCLSLFCFPVPVYGEGEPTPTPTGEASPTPTPVLPPTLEDNPEDVMPADPTAKRPMMIAVLSIALICSILILFRVISLPSIRRKKRESVQREAIEKPLRKRKPKDPELDLVTYNRKKKSPLDARPRPERPPIGSSMMSKERYRREMEALEQRQREEEEAFAQERARERREAQAAARIRPANRRKPVTYAERRRRLAQKESHKKGDNIRPFPGKNSKK
ncbi:hypothetical protein LJC20_03570 [Eubacteriales bacterium OttesenSCG-928-M02]|nr:hypothetical protein [Eubacteriales bacterium OttesenSCG-928-M02]